MPALSKTSVFASAFSAPLRATLARSVARRGAENAERPKKKAFLQSRICLICACYAGSRCDLRPLRHHALLECRQEEQDVVRPAAESHQADAPHFTFEVSQAAADLDTKICQEAFPSRQIIDAVRNPHGIEHRQLMAFRGRVGNPECSQASFQ